MSKRVIFVFLISVTSSVGIPFTFTDVTAQVGLDRSPKDKVSGPSIADLNQDGYLDILQSNHGRSRPEVYYGSATGTFRRQERLVASGDRHGTCVGDVDNNGIPDAIVVTGAVRNLADLPHVRIELSNSGGSFNLTTPQQTGFTKRNGYLFGCRLMDMDGDGDLDLLGQGGLNQGVNNHIYQNLGRGKFRELSITSINLASFSPFALGYLVTDYNADGILDIILYGNRITVFKGGPNFQYTDVTTQVLPSSYSSRKFNSAAQIDIDNDGDFDLYFTGGFRLKLDGIMVGPDLLLENRGGVFVDISRQAGIPMTGGRNGVGVADFDNDGYLDLFLGTAMTQPIVPNVTRQLDVMLRNNGDKTFTAYTNHGAAERNRASDLTYPAGLQPFDYNRDGLVDILMGTRFNSGRTDAPGLILGKLQLFKNTVQNANHWIVVRVPVNIQGRTTMDALIKLQTPGGWLYRRVGSVGEGRAHSFIDHVHFGLGSNSVMQQVVIELVGGSVRVVNNLQGVKTNQIYTFHV
mmetsp:Transcript_16928/g.35139  ORF Transcript_16928/g.35139 Transcript_16928/m.35139 type:complete len:520 (-) Transcript_16928:112-1671(-)